MTDHLQHGSTDPQSIHSPDAEQHEAHVTDGTAGDPTLDVVLGEGVQGAINDVDDAEDHQGRGQGEMGVRQHLHVETQQGIAAHLQQHSRQQHRDRGVGFAVGIRQPGVQGEHRQFHAEAHQESEVAEQSEASTRRTRGQLCEVQGELITRQGQGQSADQDQQRGQSCVQDEFGGGVLTVLSAPDRNQQINRHQLQLPGQEEEQEIL